MTASCVRNGIIGGNLRLPAKHDRYHGDLLDLGAMRPPLCLTVNNSTWRKHSIGRHTLPDWRHP